MALLRAAVIGLGMGIVHTKRYSEGEETELVAVVDQDPSRLEKFKDTLGENGCFTDYKVMLREIKPDIVSIALPNFLHKTITIDCLRAGAHVLCEKPMALNVQEALEMESVAKETNRQIGINLSYRYTPAAYALHEYAKNGFLGTPYHAYTRWMRRDGFPRFGGWFGQKSLSGGGPLIDLGVHRIDLALWLMGLPEPLTVSGQAHHHIGVSRGKKAGLPFDVEDLAAGFIRFKNGASMIFEISWAGHQADEESMETRVMGDQGTLIHRNLHGGYAFQAEAYQVVNRVSVKSILEISEKSAPSSINAFAKAIAEGKPVPCGTADGIRIQRILDALYQSAIQGKEIEVGSIQ